MSAEKLKYLEMIQSVVTRMAANQMQLRASERDLGGRNHRLCRRQRGPSSCGCKREGRCGRRATAEPL